ncbi:10689_t:CDS:2 [Dentiscutata erythropus]|uniref:10689_t:CDS:1 n=1 Tax=Dentiscutata erythropus TaxID=1348616 RepID=A0A9N9EKE9_9GLOM|nr:10689_t:CDS:2 [Dentiscutata erythropus]
MDNEMERLQDLVFRLRAKVKLYEDKFGPLNNSSVDITKSEVVNEETESTKDIIRTLFRSVSKLGFLWNKAKHNVNHP